MKKNLTLLLVAAIIVSLPYNSFAWGRKGHTIVGEIAFSFLDANTKQAVTKYLGSMDLEQAGSWMDDMRSNHTYDYMKTWHYVDFEKGTQYEPNKDENLVNALNTAIEKLENKDKDKLSDEDIKTNLLIVFHLVGDLHMPLHIGYSGDKGGNTVNVTYLGKPTNLHKVWDTEIIESEHITANDCLALYKDFNKKEIEQFRVINVETWIKEPRSLLGRVYDVKDGAIDQAYIDKNKKIVEQQLLIAGIRLSAVLERVFKS